MNSSIFVSLLFVGLASASGWGHDDGSWKGEGLVHYGHGGIHKYGPAPLAHDGRVLDTPEVAHAKAAHLAAHSAAAHAAPAHGAWAPSAPAHGAWAPAAPAHGAWAPAAHGAWAPAANAWAPAAHAAWAPDAHYGKWTGPAAHIELTHDGKFLKDTPEVAHAKASHAALYSQAAHAAAAQPDYGHENAYAPAHGHGW